MLLAGSILAMIARLPRRRLGAGKLSWRRERRKPNGGAILPRAKRFLTLDIADPNSGEIRSVGLYLMAHPASYTAGTRVYGATIVDQSATAHSARFITDGRNCLIVFTDIQTTILMFQLKPWSRRITVIGTLPDAAASNDNDVDATCVQQLYASARSIIDADHPKTISDVNKIRRRVAKLLHPDLGSAIDGACRARAMALMNGELDDIGSRLAA